MQLAAVGEEALITAAGGKDLEPCDTAPTTLFRIGAIGVRWSVPLPGPAAVVVAPDQTVYAAVGRDDQVTLLHLDEGGRTMSSVDVPAPPSSGPTLLAVGADGDLYVDRNPYTMRVRSDGTVVWTKPVEAGAHAVLAGDRLVFADGAVAADGTGGASAKSLVTVLDAATGAAAWAHHEGPTPTTGDLKSFAPYTDLVGTPDGTIYLATSSDARSLDRRGNDRWRRNDRHATSLALLPSGHLAIGYVDAEASGGIELVDPSTGNAPADASDAPIVRLGFPGLPDRIAATAGGDLLVADPWTVSAWREVGDAR
jgi:outer membrane protein assembly factor BamB